MIEEQQSLEIGSGDKKLKLTGSDLLASLIGMIVCAGLALNLYVLLEHKTDAKEAIETARSNAEALRELSCLIMFPPGAERDKMAPFCKQQAHLP
jgi:hypothetical protein